MNWETIKYIYRCVLVYGDKIEYLDGDRYRLTYYYNGKYGSRKVQREYKNKLRHGISKFWAVDKQISCEEEWWNGSFVRQIYPE